MRRAIAKKLPDAEAFAQKAADSGQRAFERGDLKSANNAIEEALASLGRPVPRNVLAWAVQLGCEILLRLASSMLPRWLMRRRDSEEGALDLQCAHSYSQLFESYASSGNAIQTLGAHFAGLNLSDRYSPTMALAQTYADAARLFAALGWFKRACTYADKSEATYLQANPRHSSCEGPAFYARSVVLCAASRFPECVEASQVAIHMFDETEHVWHGNRARYQLATAFLRLGRISEAIDEAKKTYQEGSEFARKQAFGNGLDIWAIASDGQVPHHVLELELSRPCQDPGTMTQLLLAEGIRLLHLNRLEEAIDALEEGHAIDRRAALTNPNTGWCQVWLITALRTLAQQRNEAKVGDARSELYLAGKSARRALRRARNFQNQLPHALRESAAIATLKGNAAKARRLFDESLAVADQQHACYEYAKTLEVRGMLGEDLCWEEAGDDVADARYIRDALRQPQQHLLGKCLIQYRRT
jgi:two-component system sensor kinase